MEGADVEYSPPLVLWDLLATVKSEGSNEPVVDDPSVEGSTGGN